MSDPAQRLRAADGKFLPEPRIPHRIRLRYLPGIDPTPEWWTIAHTPLGLHRHEQIFLPGFRANANNNSTQT
jgi:hypothetical protein